MAGLVFAMSVPWHLDLRGNEYENTDTIIRALLSSTSLESLNRLTVHGEEPDKLARVIQRDRCAKCLLKHAVFRLTLCLLGRPTGCAAICYTRKRFTVCCNMWALEPSVCPKAIAGRSWMVWIVLSGPLSKPGLWPEPAAVF